MRREIRCLPCAKNLRHHSGFKIPDTRGMTLGEAYDTAMRALHENILRANTDEEGKVKEVPGYLLVGSRCDFCNKLLKPGEEVVAISHYSKRRPYFPWEKDVLSPKEKACG